MKRFILLIVLPAVGIASILVWQYEADLQLKRKAINEIISILASSQDKSLTHHETTSAWLNAPVSIEAVCPELKVEGWDRIPRTAYLSDDGSILYWTTDDSSLCIWDIAHSKLLTPLDQARIKYPIRVSSDSRYIALRAKDEAIVLLSLPQLDTVSVLPNSDVKNEAVWLFKSPPTMAVSNRSTVNVYSVPEMNLLTSLDIGPDKIAKLIPNTNGSLLLTIGYRKNVVLWSFGSKTLLYRFQGSWQFAKFSPKDSYIIAYRVEVEPKPAAKLAIWRTNSLDILLRLNFSDFRTSFSVSPDERYLLVKGFKIAEIYELPTGKRLCQLKDVPHYPAFSMDSEYVFGIRRADNSICMWDASSGALVRVLAKDKVGFSNLDYDLWLTVISSVKMDGTIVLLRPGGAIDNK
jgi:WD40 repeat protein